MRRGVKIVLGVDGEVGAFREVLMQQAVRVLVASALPWAFRVTEVDLDAGWSCLGFVEVDYWILLSWSVRRTDGTEGISTGVQTPGG